MSDADNPASEQPQGPIAAPSLDGAVGWLNVAAPISMAQLRGKVVILDFWTYGCINCMHILRDLRTLEARFPDELVVIGVHSPKFTNEKDHENLKRILVRYEIERPVANDADHQIWRRSPWDLALKPGILIIAMAGRHQIWVVDLLHGQAYPQAGTGEEATTDGPVNTAAFAQPSGLAIDGNTLQVADAEANVIRALELPPANTVATLAGGDLFTFGDHDGQRDTVRLQHPLGVAVHAGRVFIADTYNHKIKMLDPVSAQVTTFAGTGQPGHADGPSARARFFEPGGLSAAGNTLYVADTNNHAIRTIDLATKQVGTLAIDGLAPPIAWSYLR